MIAPRCWVARLPGDPGDAWAAGSLRDALGHGAGWLVAWRQDNRPCPGALLADARALDPAGEPAWISLAWASEGFDLLFDDPAVQRARQVVLEDEPPAAVTTLSRDASHIGGALTARRGVDARRRLADDPFARLLPAVLLEVGPGLIGRSLPPASLVLERYGGKPWPAEGFD